MAKFKCKLSGTEVEFVLEHDIQTMRTHPDYDEVLEEASLKTETTPKKQKKVENG